MRTKMPGIGIAAVQMERCYSAHIRSLWDCAKRVGRWSSLIAATRWHKQARTREVLCLCLWAALHFGFAVRLARLSQAVRDFGEGRADRVEAVSVVMRCRNCRPPLRRWPRDSASAKR